MKPLMLSLILILTSCQYTNLAIDKTQAISETETTLVVPHSAVTPIIDQSATNKAIAETIIKLAPLILHNK